jgi:hypothetical protein
VIGKPVGQGVFVFSGAVVLVSNKSNVINEGMLTDLGSIVIFIYQTRAAPLSG